LSDALKPFSQCTVFMVTVYNQNDSVYVSQYDLINSQIDKKFISTPAEFKIESVKFLSGNYLQFVDKKFSILYIIDFK
jgi:hypothetical protein